MTPSSRRHVAVSRRGASPACRQRAWEQRRAAAFGRSAVEIIEREFQVAIVPPEPLHAEWNAHLGRFAAHLDDGSIYDRDLAALTQSLNEVLAAFTRRVRNAAAAEETAGSWHYVAVSVVDPTLHGRLPPMYPRPTPPPGQRRC